MNRPAADRQAHPPILRRDPEWDVVVVGDGPAGLALAKACRDEHLRVVVVGADRPWNATYGAWLDERSQVTADVLAAWGPVDAVGHRRHHLAVPYGIFDNDLLKAKLGQGLDRVVDIVVGVEHDVAGSTLTCLGGGSISARLVVDATGSIAALLAPHRRPPALQTAYGVVVHERPDTVGGSHGVLMDWTPPPGFEGREPTFLYSLPLGRHRWLVEETSLARAGGLAMDELRARLVARVGQAVVSAAEQTEEVVIPMAGGVPDRTQLVVGYGAAAGYVHPATGYSITASMLRAPLVAAAIVDSLDLQLPDRAAMVWNAVWPAGMRRVRHIHDFGQTALLRLTAEDVGTFFDAFFDQPPERWRRYLEIDCPPATARAVMRGVFRAVPWTVRRRLAAQGPVAFARLFR